MYSLAEENYLKAIYKLQEKHGNWVGTNDISNAIQNKAASVTDMIKRLSDKELLDYERYKGVKLSSLGEKIAINIIRKHRLWEYFLVEKLKYKWDEVHEIAEQLEHIQSDDLSDRLDDYLGNPKYDPHGDPIPNKKGTIQAKKICSLFEMEIGEKGNISGVEEHSPMFLQYLERIGIYLGVEIKIEDKNEFDQSMWISIDNAKPITITEKVANNLFIFESTLKK